MSNSNSYDLVRLEVVKVPKIIAVKVGTRVLTRSDGSIDDDRVSEIANGICDLAESQKKVVLISSGAVGCGISQLGLSVRPHDVAKLQAVAAVGQAQLIQKYNSIFEKRGKSAAQVLLTTEDVNHRTRYLNVRNTIFSLFEFGAIPIINENDTVAVEELVTRFGDNDQLAACITNLIGAELLIFLSDVSGLYDANPESKNAQRVSIVAEIDQKILDYVADGNEVGQLSLGGMKSKVRAAKIVTTAGENVIIASGREPGIFQKIMAGQDVGTLFLAKGRLVSPRKRWIGFSAQAKGQIKIDEGAVQAICQNEKSLLPIGVVEVSGEFDKGDALSICDKSGLEVAKGLTNYSNTELQKIRGLRSNLILQVLDHEGYEEVVHRDNLVVL